MSLVPLTFQFESLSHYIVSRMAVIERVVNVVAASSPNGIAELTAMLDENTKKASRKRKRHTTEQQYNNTVGAEPESPAGNNAEQPPSAEAEEHDAAREATTKAIKELTEKQKHAVAAVKSFSKKLETLVDAVDQDISSVGVQTIGHFAKVQRLVAYLFETAELVESAYSAGSAADKAAELTKLVLDTRMGINHFLDGAHVRPPAAFVVPEINVIDAVAEQKKKRAAAELKRRKAAEAAASNPDGSAAPTADDLLHSLVNGATKSRKTRGKKAAAAAVTSEAVVADGNEPSIVAIQEMAPDAIHVDDSVEPTPVV